MHRYPQLVPEYMSTSEGLLNVKEYGGTGGTVLLIHGLGGSVANWDAVGPGLTEIGRTVALDLPGFGLSPPASDWELSTHSSAICEAISALGGRATLIGNSMGALLSEMVAADHPEMVEALVLLSPATPPRLPDPRLHWPSARRLLIQALPGIGPAFARSVLRGNSPEELVRMSLQLVSNQPGRVPLELVESFVELARTRQKLPWAVDAAPKTGNSIARFFLPPSRFVAMIRRIESPTLVVHGLEDHIVSPTSVSWLCSLRPDWDLVQMEDTGHVPQIDAPVRLLGLMLPWLQERQRREFSA